MTAACRRQASTLVSRLRETNDRRLPQAGKNFPLA